MVPGNAARGKPTVNGAVTLYDDLTGELTALVDFHLVTKWKTAGDSLLAASRLARKDARKFLLVGAGTVARSMVQAYGSLWPDAEFTVWSRSRDSAAAMGLRVADDLETAVRGADVICTATMATSPLIRGEWLHPGQHLDLIGAYKPGMREVDDTAMQRARLFVDARATTVHHIGEIMDPIASGAISEGHIVADYYDDPALFGRRSDDEITIAKKRRRRASGPDDGNLYRQGLGGAVDLGNLVGVKGFEPSTPCSRSRCATRLRYTPTLGAG